MLLTKMRERDLERGFHQALLEDLCLRGCGIRDADLDVLKTTCPWVDCHANQREALESSTRVWE